MKHILSILILLFSFSAEAQEKTFPEDYLGSYKGELEITNNKGKQRIAMEFHLTKTDSVGIYNYILAYVINDKLSPRKYLLKTINKEKGDYIIDENNGILLDAKLIDNALYNVFEVDNNLLLTTERFFDDYMEFEIVFSGKDKKKITQGNQKTPMVISYPVTLTQKAKLIKQ